MVVLSFDGCDAITDKGVAVLVKHCPNLLSLSLRGSQITNQSVERLCQLRYLRWLDIAECDRITDTKACAATLAKMQQLRYMLVTKILQLC